MSERLLGVWIAKNNLRVKEYRIINTDDKHNIFFWGREILKAINVEKGIKLLLTGKMKRKNSDE